MICCTHTDSSSSQSNYRNSITCHGFNDREKEVTFLEGRGFLCVIYSDRKRCTKYNVSNPSVLQNLQETDMGNGTLFTFTNCS